MKKCPGWTIGPAVRALGQVVVFPFVFLALRRPEPEAVAPGLEDMAVMGEPIE
jgi:hypothetical protein